MKSTRYDEAHLKACVLSALRRYGLITEKAVVASELRLPQVGARADLAIMGDQFLGVEIKGPLDTLARLENQLSAYQSYFDKVLLVVSSRHLPNLPDRFLGDVEIWEFTERGELLTGRYFELLAPSVTPRLSPLNFLTQYERKKYAACADTVGVHSAGDQERSKEILRIVFQERYGVTTKSFWRAVGHGDVKPKHLPKLSRFHDQRVKINTYERERQAHWAEWLQSAQRLFGETASPQGA